MKKTVKDMPYSFDKDYKATGSGFLGLSKPVVWTLGGAIILLIGFGIYKLIK